MEYRVPDAERDMKSRKDKHMKENIICTVSWMKRKYTKKTGKRRKSQLEEKIFLSKNTTIILNVRQFTTIVYHTHTHYQPPFLRGPSAPPEYTKNPMAPSK